MFGFKLVYNTTNIEQICNKEMIDKLWSVAERITLLWGAEFCNFEREENTVYPMEGSNVILGTLIPLVNYNTNNFCQLIKETKPSSISVCTLTDLPNSMKSLFDSAKSVKYYDYSQMITSLEAKGYISCLRSSSFLCNDERRFVVLEKVCGVVKDLGKYVNQAYEVDSLGSAFFDELSCLIRELYQKSLM